MFLVVWKIKDLGPAMFWGRLSNGLILSLKTILL